VPGRGQSAEWSGLPLCPLARGERWKKTCQSELSAVFDIPWEEAGEPRGLASSAGVWGKPVRLCPVASQGGKKCYQVNPLAICAWRSLPQSE